MNIFEQLKSSEFGTKNRVKRILLVEKLEKDIIDLQLSAHQSNFDQMKTMKKAELIKLADSEISEWTKFKKDLI